MWHAFINKSQLYIIGLIHFNKVFRLCIIDRRFVFKCLYQKTAEGCGFPGPWWITGKDCLKILDADHYILFFVSRFYKSSLDCVYVRVWKRVFVKVFLNCVCVCYISLKSWELKIDPSPFPLPGPLPSSPLCVRGGGGGGFIKDYWVEG